MTDENIILLCEKLISRQKLEREELGGLILLLSLCYEDEQILYLRKNYPHQTPVVALLLDIMRTRGLTRRQFAEQLGISCYQLGVILRRENRISIETARRLTGFLIDGNFLTKLFRVNLKLEIFSQYGQSLRHRSRIHGIILLRYRALQNGRVSPIV